MPIESITPIVDATTDEASIAAATEAEASDEANINEQVDAILKQATEDATENAGTGAPAPDAERSAAAAVDTEPVEPVAAAERSPLDLAKETAARWKAKARAKASARAEAARAQLLEAELRREKAAHAELLRQQERLERDPLGVLEERGHRAEDLVARAVESSDPAARIKRLEAELAAERRARTEWMAEQDRRVQEAERVRSVTAVQESYKVVASDATKYPVLSRHMRARPAAVVRESIDAAREGAQKLGRMPTHEEVAEYMNWLYSQIDSPQAAASAVRPRATEAARPTPQAGARPTPKTLSQREAQMRARLPKNFDELSSQDQNELLLKQVRAITHS